MPNANTGIPRSNAVVGSGTVTMLTLSRLAKLLPPLPTTGVPFRKATLIIAAVATNVKENGYQLTVPEATLLLVNPMQAPPFIP